MNKTDFYSHLSLKFTKYSWAKVKKAVNAIVDEMDKQIISGGRIEVRGFGSFVSYPAQRLTVPPIYCKSHKEDGSKILFKFMKIKFKPGKELRGLEV